MMETKTSLTRKGKEVPDDQAPCQTALYGKDKGEDNGMNDTANRRAQSMRAMRPEA
jgi:hypothetical protein